MKPARLGLLIFFLTCYLPMAFSAPEENVVLIEGDRAAEVIQDLWDKFQQQGSFKCTEVLSLTAYLGGNSGKEFLGDEKSAVSHFWSKGPYTRTEGESLTDPYFLTVRHPEHIYRLEEETGSFSGKVVEEDLSRKQPIDYMKLLTKGQVERVEEGLVIDSKQAVAIYLKIKERNNGPLLPVSRIWVWEDSGIAFEAEIVQDLAGGALISRVKCKNFVFNNVPDELFDVSNPAPAVVTSQSIPRLKLVIPSDKLKK